ncbi:MAG: phosphoribosylaminoimidazolesuccinocarboxamide synthase [Dehalococcoidales bacterium]|nr:phosphoribosylaminoimidazolesuccinocarboxamide synthase [Dehalococcoidales bacterium]
MNKRKRKKLKTPEETGKGPEVTDENRPEEIFESQTDTKFEYIAEVLLTTDLPLPLFIRGKTRDVYELGDHLLIVASDRISAFDVILPCGIPNKGRVLSQLSAFWFKKTTYKSPNHFVELINDTAHLDSYLPQESRFAYPDYLKGRSIVVKKAKRFPIECVVRGFLAGSAWKEYEEYGTVSGISVMKGLLESHGTPYSLYTPTTKAEEGHDLPMTMDEVVKVTGEARAKEIKDLSIAIYEFASKIARLPGRFHIADTKLEFGLDENDELIVIDELLTPDSSRFWDMDIYKVGKPQDSFDKQPVRDWLESSGWNKEPPAPVLPPEVIEQTAERYQQVFERLTGTKLE